MAVEYIGHSVVMIPQQPEINNELYYNPPSILINLKYKGNSAEDTIYSEIKNNYQQITAAGEKVGEEKKDLTDFNIILTSAKLTPVTGGNVGVTQASPQFSNILRVESTSGFYSSMQIIVNGNNSFKVLAVLTSTDLLVDPILPVAIDAGFIVTAGAFEHEPQMAIQMINKFAPRGAYSISVDIYHKWSNILIKNIKIDFKYYGRDGQGMMPDFYEHQWAYITQNPQSKEFDRIIISHDVPTVFIDPGEEITRTILIQNLKDKFVKQIIDSRKQIKFTPKTNYIEEKQVII